MGQMTLLGAQKENFDGYTEERKKIVEAHMEKVKEHNERIERDQKFSARFKLGSTTVYLREGIYYFCGDISHCGEESIFHNAREIRKDMLSNNRRYGHMTYNDEPTYEAGYDFEKFDRERKNCYKEDLYKFVGDEIIKVEEVLK